MVARDAAPVKTGDEADADAEADPDADPEATDEAETAATDEGRGIAGVGPRTIELELGVAAGLELGTSTGITDEVGVEVDEHLSQ